MTIYFLNPLNEPVASGGVQKLHDHVEILTDAGIDAAIVNTPRFEPWWFTTRAPIVRPPVALKRGDLLAIPEVYGDRLNQIAPGYPRVSINQNAFMTFDNVADSKRHPYLSCPWLLGIMTMSAHDFGYLTHTFPSLYVQRAFYRIDADVFGFAEGPRSKLIAYMPRKRRQLAAQIVGSLYARGALDGWTFRELHGMSQAQVADVLGTAQLFLSFSHREGFGLPPAEALARGCHVIGYSGWGGNEFFDGPNARLIAEDDLDGFVSAVAEWTTQRSWDANAARLHSDAVLQTYSRERERESVAGFFAAMRDRAAAEAPPAATITIRDVVINYRGPLFMAAKRVKSKLEQMIGG